MQDQGPWLRSLGSAREDRQELHVGRHCGHHRDPGRGLRRD